jgi:hypothetical protein
MILYSKLEFLVLFWPKIVFFRYGSRGFFFFNRVNLTRLEVEDDDNLF